MRPYAHLIEVQLCTNASGKLSRLLNSRKFRRKAENATKAFTPTCFTKGGAAHAHTSIRRRNIVDCRYFIASDIKV